MERLTNRGTNGEIWIIDNDATRLKGRKECAYEKLAHYEDLAEQGRLVELPCKVGDVVYAVASDCGGDTLDCRRQNCQHCVDFHKFVEECEFDLYMISEVGKTVFLTKAEAEQALAEQMKEV